MQNTSLTPEKGEQCPHCGKVDTHIGYVCSQIKAVEFDGSFIRRIEYRDWPLQHFYPSHYIPPQVPVYPYANPRPMVTPCGPFTAAGGGGVGNWTNGVCISVPNGGWVNPTGWNNPEQAYQNQNPTTY